MFKHGHGVVPLSSQEAPFWNGKSALRLPCKASSERKPWIAFKNLQLQTRSLTFAPQPGSMSRAIQERASVGALAVLDGARDTNKLRFEAIAANANDRITVTTHVDERNVR